MSIEVSQENADKQLAEVIRLKTLQQIQERLQGFAPEVQEKIDEALSTVRIKSRIYKPAEERKKLTATATKSKFIESIYSWLIATLKLAGNGDYSNIFKVEGSSIICNIPDDYFQGFAIPEGVKIEMKFISKK